MEIRNRFFRSTDELRAFFKKGEPMLLVSSQTSTVIPYHLLEARLGEWAQNHHADHLNLVELGQLPKDMNLDKQGNLHISGSVTWEDAITYCQNHGRTIKTYPTERLAAIPAGVATSATGERCFGFGTLREQVVSLSFMSQDGEIHHLSRQNKLKNIPGLEEYQKDFLPFHDFKNAPFPRFENEPDLLIGTEGQLGPVLNVELETTPLEDVRYFFILLPPWEKNYTPHLELFHKVQRFKGDVLSCEILDRHCMKLLPENDQLGPGKDVIFLEVRGEEAVFDRVFEEFLMDFEHIDDEWIFEIPEDRFHHIRAEVPRAIFENNQRMGVEKKGTDIQVKPDDFEKLMDECRAGARVGLPYFLFGHFGNAHLHFNFLPKTDEVHLCNDYFHDLYEKILLWQGSPFAEHGIGLVKQRYIQPFHSETQYKVFRALKDLYDPERRFFPMGFMSGPFEENFSD